MKNDGLQIAILLNARIQVYDILCIVWDGQ